MLGMATFGEGDDGRSSNTDRKDFAVYGRVEPFTKMKNKWIEGLGFETIGVVVQRRPASRTHRRRSIQREPALREIRAHAGVCRSRTMATAAVRRCFSSRRRVAPVAPRIGSGLARVGKWDPTRCACGGVSRITTLPITDQGVDAKGRDFLIAHDMFLWSPKGFLTGDSTIPGSVLIGHPL